MRTTQPFGVDYIGSNGPGGQSYADIGLPNGHNGTDYSALTGTPCYAVMDGQAFYSSSSGYGNDLRIRSRELGLEVIYGHLQRSAVATGSMVKAGQVIAYTDNTGWSTGPHLHFGIRRIRWDPSGAGPYVVDAANGYQGYIDPKPFFETPTTALPVDVRYGLTTATPGVPSDASWAKTKAWAEGNLKRPLTVRENNALRFGFYDLRTVIDDAMWPVWSTMTKPEAVRRGILK